MGKSKKKNYSPNEERKQDDVFWSKNHGESIKYRRRLVEEREARQAREEALRELDTFPEWYEGMKE